MYQSRPLPSMAALSLLGIAGQAHADHPTIAFGSEAAGPIGTIPTAPLPAGSWSAGLRSEIVNFDRYSDRELADFAAAGEEHVHSVDRLLSVSVSLAYGVTDDLTLSARLPYVDRQNIREGEIEDGKAEAHDHGDSNGIGDLSLLGQYRFFEHQAFDASVIGGVKAPTGKTDVRDGGQKLDTEFQPGTGSWDWLFGGSASVNSGRMGLHANVLYNLTTEGSQDTEIGDAFFYNLGLVYSLSGGHEEAHQGHDHSHLKWDLILELNGEYREKTMSMVNRTITPVAMCSSCLRVYGYPHRTNGACFSLWAKPSTMISMAGKQTWTIAWSADSGSPFRPDLHSGAFVSA